MSRLPARPGPRAGSSTSAPATPHTLRPPASTSKVLTDRRAVRAGRARTGASDDPLVRQKLARLVDVLENGRVDGQAGGGGDGQGPWRRSCQRGQARPDPHHQAVDRDRLRHRSAPAPCCGTPTARSAGRYAEALRLLGRVVDLRWHRPDPAQRHRRARRSGCPGSRTPTRASPSREVLRSDCASGASQR